MEQASGEHLDNLAAMQGDRRYVEPDELLRNRLIVRMKTGERLTRDALFFGLCALFPGVGFTVVTNQRPRGFWRRLWISLTGWAVTRFDVTIRLYAYEGVSYDVEQLKALANKSIPAGLSWNLIVDSD